MANEDVIESLKLEIDVGIKGQGALTQLSESLKNLASVLTEVNQKLANYSNVAKGVIKTPKVETPKTPDVKSSPMEAVKGAAEAAAPLKSANEEIKKVSENMDKAASSAKKAGAEIKKAGEETKKAGNSAKKSSSHFGGLLKTFLRIAKLRAMRAILRTITEGFREGVQNMARYSSEFNGVMSQFSTSTLYLKNSLGAAARPILEALIPALTKLIDVVVKVLNVFAQLFSVMQGKTTYSRAKKYAVDYADSLGNATDKAKELKKTLLGFDEINQLNDNSSSSTSSAGGMDYSQMFEDVAIDSGIIEFWDKVKAAIPTEAVEHFKEAWDRCKEAIEKLKNSEAWKKIKEFLAAITGFSLGALIEGFADLLDLITAISEFIADPSWKKFLTVIEKLCDLILSLPDYVDMVLKMKIDESDLPEWAKKLLHAGRWLLNIFLKATIPGGTAFDIIRKIVNGEFAKEMKAAAKDVKDAWDSAWEENGEDNGAVRFFKSLWAAIKAVFGFGDKEKVSGGGGGEPEKLGDSVVTGFFTPIKDKWDSFWSPIKDKIETIKTTFTEKANNIKTNVSNAFTTVKTNVSNALESIKTKATSVWNTVSSGAKNFVNNGIISPSERMINSVLKGLRWLLDKAKKIINAFPESVRNTLHLDRIANATVEDVKLPRFAQGGFPEDGLFMANHTELVGRFSNGRTAVANNEQIQAGIEEAAYRGFMRAMGVNNNNGTYTFVAQLNGKTIFEEVVKQNDSAKKYYGKSPLLSY